jgi:arginine deiminase
MPNLYFTRDPFSIIGEGVSISRMFTTTRSRETIYADYVFKYHPTYKRVTQHLYGRNEMSSIEGGDILVLSDKLIAVGVSQRTHPAAIEKLAKNLFYRYPTTFEKVLAFDIPKGRAFMHLDTVLTQVDVDKFAIHNELNHTIRIYECTRDPKREGKLVVKPIEQPLHKILETYLERKITLIPCGGSNIVNSDREQWSDGANMMALAPGVVISYERNHITNALLKEHGITVYEIPSSELSRGRGGPRCMSMPLIREDLNDDTGGKKE